MSQNISENTHTEYGGPWNLHPKFYLLNNWTRWFWCWLVFFSFRFFFLCKKWRESWFGRRSNLTSLFSRKTSTSTWVLKPHDYNTKHNHTLLKLSCPFFSTLLLWCAVCSFHFPLPLYSKTQLTHYPSICRERCGLMKPAKCSEKLEERT